MYGYDVTTRQISFTLRYCFRRMETLVRGENYVLISDLLFRVAPLGVGIWDYFHIPVTGWRVFPLYIRSNVWREGEYHPAMISFSILLNWIKQSTYLESLHALGLLMHFEYSQFTHISPAHKAMDQLSVDHRIFFSMQDSNLRLVMQKANPKR